MKRWPWLLSMVLLSRLAAADPFRPPAVPLVTHNPFLSIWSEADKLTDKATQHWTHRAHPLVSLVRVDGAAYRLMGNDPADVPALPQVGLRVTPTRSTYDFENEKVHVTLTFLTAALPDDLEVLCRPLTYLTWQVRAVDGGTHAVALYDSTSGLLTVNQPSEPVVWGREACGPLTALHIGTKAQPVLGSAGDDHRLDWGYVYAAAPTAQAKAAVGANDVLLKGFVADGGLPAADDAAQPRPANSDQPVLAFAFDLGQVGAEAVSRQVIVALDELYTVKWFGKPLRPYWRRNGATPAELLPAAAADYAKLAPRCEAFDKELLADAERAGGQSYADLIALAYRQALCACGLAADRNGQPLFFTKENTSNGDIATVDVFYPMDPMLILLSPTLAKASVVPVLIYGSSPRWRWPCSPHDLGTYPIVRGTDDGGEAMPVEESGNMILLCDAISQATGSAEWLTPWWPALSKWVDYLEKFGLDPENQLCTDDFMGHLAHNANLSVKAILGLAAFGDLCRMRGDTAGAERYANLAKTDSEHWLTVAADGDHSRLAFDKPNTWSQKYNLVWDQILGLKVFPPSLAASEIAQYKKVIQKYGVPLDSRTHLAKTDWSLWAATLADNRADFEALVTPIHEYFGHTTARDPLADSYQTDNVRSGGMHARPVIGGLFVKLLSDRATWLKWAHRDPGQPGGWAALPLPPTVTEVVPVARTQSQLWRYTTVKPADDWMQPGFDDSAWKQGQSGFGTRGTPGAVIGTVWNTDDIWLRREITVPEGEHPNLQWLVHHDDDVWIYANGVLGAAEPGYYVKYQPMPISAAARAQLKPGAKVLIAVHCHQITGGQFIDVGLADVVEH
jgi:hypothetical protein